MTYSNFLKIITKIIIYILVAGGAFIMILPFAWMIMTSLKTDGEVNSWPPTWTSKNFLSERELNMELSTSTISSRGTLNLSEFRSISRNKEFDKNKIVYYINDDDVMRGQFLIDFGNVDYASEDSLNKLYNEIENLKSNLDLDPNLVSYMRYDEENVKNFEKIYFNLFSNSNGFFKKTNIGNSIKNNITSSIRFIDNMLENNIDRLPYLRVNNNTPETQKEYIESRKEYLRKYLNKLKDELQEMNDYVTENAKGLGLISDNEAQNYISLMNEYLSLQENFEEDDILYRTNALLNNNLISPFITNFNSLTVFNRLTNAIDNIQNEEVQNLSLSVKIPTSEMMYENFINDFKQSNFDEELKEMVMRVVSESNIKFLKDVITTEIESTIIEEISSNLADQGSNVSVYANILRSLSENEANLDNYNYVLSSSNSNFLDSQLSEKRDELQRILNLRKKYDNFIGEFSDFYGESTSITKIIEGHELVEKVLFKENSKIEVHLNGIISTWMLDEIPNVKVEFSFSEIFKNIFQNYVTAWNAAPFSQYYVNTVFMATTTTIFEIIIASMAAFAFAKLKFWGKNVIFTIFLATMMVPGEVLLVPNYITISRFQWIDSYYALIVPWVVSVFAIFLLRQQFMTVPNDLWDAAKIDGSSSWRFLWTVMVPLSKPALLTGALLKFVGSWNAFLWVLIVTKSPEMRTLAVGLQTFRSESGEIYNLLMAASTFSMIPIVIIFIVLQRYFVEGIAKSGLKG
ncbi:MAG: ABC transporter permease subunit [Thermotogota bacterium]